MLEVKGRLCGHLTVVFSTQSSILEVKGRLRLFDGGLDTIISWRLFITLSTFSGLILSAGRRNSPCDYFSEK
ncbi:2425_t:CDS:1, partial [Acaulospora morrowiae]